MSSGRCLTILNHSTTSLLVSSPQLEAGTYKTVLCKFFEAGNCSRGASCTFAHGDTELSDQGASVPVTGSGSCAVAATAFATTSLADAIAQRRLDHDKHKTIILWKQQQFNHRLLQFSVDWFQFTKAFGGLVPMACRVGSLGFPRHGRRERFGVGEQRPRGSAGAAHSAAIQAPAGGHR